MAGATRQSLQAARDAEAPTAREALRLGAERLRLAGIDSPRMEARVLLAHSLGMTPTALLRDLGVALDPNAYWALIARRVAHEPLALILGHREFWSLEFAVSPATLIPRADSETLIEAALAAFAERAPPCRILDLGTGTGCLLLAALSEFPGAQGIGIDRSRAAAELAARNAAMLGMENRAAFLCGDWAAAINGRFDLILANPPYIASADITGLMPEVAGYEPRTALDGGPDGCTAYRRLIPDLRRLLTPNGVAVLELGQGQADIVAGLAREAELSVGSRADLNGIIRALVLRPRLPRKNRLAERDGESSLPTRRGEPHSGVSQALWPNRSSPASMGDEQQAGCSPEPTPMDRAWPRGVSPECLWGDPCVPAASRPAGKREGAIATE